MFFLPIGRSSMNVYRKFPNVQKLTGQNVFEVIFYEENYVQEEETLFYDNSQMLTDKVKRVTKAFRTIDQFWRFAGYHVQNRRARKRKGRQAKPREEGLDSVPEDGPAAVRDHLAARRGGQGGESEFHLGSRAWALVAKICKKPGKFRSVFGWIGNDFCNHKKTCKI